MKKLLLQPKSLIVALALMCSVSAFSQLDPNSGSGGSGSDGDPDAPIDGGVSLLIAAGAAAVPLPAQQPRDAAALAAAARHTAIKSAAPHPRSPGRTLQPVSGLLSRRQ